MRSLLLLALLAPSQDRIVEPQPPAVPTPHVSTELLDAQALTRFQLTSRATFVKPDNAFRSSATLSHELRAHLAVASGVTVNAVIPFGQLQPGVDGSRDGYVGNIALGVTWAGAVIGENTSVEGRVIRIAGGLDFYIPSSPSSRLQSHTIARALVASIRAYEPQLYISRLASARLRGQASFTFGDFHAAIEVGLVPGSTVDPPATFLMLVSAAARASYAIDGIVEPYLELGGATQIAGAGNVHPPLLVTPGIRLHVADFFDPALFMSFNFVEPSAFVIGIDLAFAARPERRQSSRDEEMSLDGLDEFDH